MLSVLTDKDGVINLMETWALPLIDQDIMMNLLRVWTLIDLDVMTFDI